MIYAVVRNNIIENTILLDNSSDWTVPEGCVLVESNGYSIGGSYIDGVYTPPIIPEPEPIPVTAVTPRQARLALLQAGLLDEVEAAVEQAGGETKITWEYATQIDRNDPLIEAIGQSLSLTEQQIDDLFTTASTL